jgi:hypothetical protein
MDDCEHVSCCWIIVNVVVPLQVEERWAHVTTNERLIAVIAEPLAASLELFCR